MTWRVARKRLRHVALTTAWYVAAALLVTGWLFGRGLELIVTFVVRPATGAVHDCLDWLEAQLP
jgi:hypothetical protein